LFAGVEGQNGLPKIYLLHILTFTVYKVKQNGKEKDPFDGGILPQKGRKREILCNMLKAWWE